MSISEKEDFNQPIDAPEILNFADIARSYCRFLEYDRNMNAEEFLLMLQRMLLILYQDASKLPIVESDEEIIIENDWDSTTWEKVFSQTIERLKDSRYYLHLFNPADEFDKDIIYGDLLDDICDIYKDIKRAIVIFDSKTKGSMNNVVWQFYFDFKSHWGDHCINAIYATHYFLKKMAE
ncbi:DUF5063 domain-containing protein [Chitinophaga sp. sic0106]|uniref:DUF5063 domain-containing protein n=1 Tax=Chitinophaga sp. sic0106 TaxID=2854785 RepID=UPI001C462576|nr:DUF5063 domain-containing protein [Chitinophaga sp. sic0106]MBV7533990.1 DUF5063 domain-containing protein [Chitinophaga sp. sic0106]